jgi:hypothetical protein
MTAVSTALAAVPVQCRGMFFLIQYIVVDFWFLLIIFKEGAVNVFLRLTDTHYI